jgi:uncharacterized OsmC-like protein
LKSNPENASVIFQSNSFLTDGFHSRASLRQHSIEVDEPKELGGTDQGPNPVELILAALGTCQEITYKAYATVLGIPIDGVSAELEGDLDLQGFLALKDGVRPGYQQIRGKVRIKSEADETTLEKLRQAVNAHCPVLDIISNPVPLKLELVKEMDDVGAKTTS